MNLLLLTLFICICILTALLILKLLDMRRSIRRIRREFSEDVYKRQALYLPAPDRTQKNRFPESFFPLSGI